MSQTTIGETVQAGRSIKMLLAALFVGSGSMIFFAGPALGLYALFIEQRSGIVFPLLWIAFGAPGLVLISGAAIAVSDFFRRGPLLVVDASSICDRRLSDQAIGWEEIEHAKVMFTRGGAVGIR